MRHSADDDARHRPRRRVTPPSPERVRLPDGIMALPGATADEASAMYRHRTAITIVAALCLVGLVLLANASELKYDWRALSFAHTYGVVAVGVPPYDTPLVVEYSDDQGAPQWVDLTPEDGTFHVGQVVDVHYDAAGVCSDVDLGWSDELQGITELVTSAAIPLIAVAVLWWHGRRWRRRVSHAAAADRHNALLRRTGSWTRRPIYEVCPPDGEPPMYVPVLPRQLVNLIADDHEIAVRGDLRRGGVVVLEHLPSGRTIWPAGAVHGARATFDRYNVGRVSGLLGPALAVALAHLLTQHASC